MGRPGCPAGRAQHGGEQRHDPGSWLSLALAGAPRCAAYPCLHACLGTQAAGWNIPAAGKQAGRRAGRQRPEGAPTLRIFLYVASGSSSKKGGYPAIISYSSTPSVHQSTALP